MRATRALALSIIAVLTLCDISRAADNVPPSFWDPSPRLEKPDLGGIKRVRFVTEDDYPPFNFALPDGQLTGFNVELVRAICEELELTCTIQRRRWDLLVAALDDDSADAIVAGLAITPENQAKVDFTGVYFIMPGRFATRVDSVLGPATPEVLERQIVAVVAGSAHEAYLKQFFPNSQLAPFATTALARLALKNGRVNALFGDATQLSFWLNGAEAEGCCFFSNGAYVNDKFFGPGLAIAVKKGATPLRLAFDYALARLDRRGVYGELFLKYFPISPF